MTLLLEYYVEGTKILTLPYLFNEELKNLPTDIKIIIFKNLYENGKNKYSKFNQSVDNLPSSLTHLTFCFYFNQSVDNLPSSLTHLTFRNNFNKSIDNLPKSITHLTFGGFFDQSVDRTRINFHVFNGVNLPSSLIHFTFGYCFNQSVDNLPKSIIELGFWSHHQFKNNIPVYVENVKINFYDDEQCNETTENLPCTLKQIKINDKNKVHFIEKYLLIVKYWKKIMKYLYKNNPPNLGLPQMTLKT